MGQGVGEQPMAVLLDSVIVIDHLNEIAKAVEYVEQVRDEALL